MSAFNPAKVKLRDGRDFGGTFYGLALGDRLYVGGDDAGIHVYDPADTKKPPSRWAGHDNYVSALAVVDEGLISGSYDRRLLWWDCERGEVVRQVEAHAGWVRDLLALPDGRHVVSAGDDMLVKVWEVETARLVRTLDGHAKQTPQGHVTALYALAASPDGRHVASADRIGAVRVWEVATGKLVQAFDVPVLYTYDPRQRKRSIGGIRALAFDPSGERLAAGGIGQVGNVDGLAGPAHVEVWDWRAPKRLWAAGLEGHKAIVNDLQFHPSGWLIGAGGGSDGGFLGFWKPDGAVGRRIKTDGHVHRIALNAAGTELYAAGYRKLTAWRLEG
jgi:WD40 repeat protein